MTEIRVSIKMLQMILLTPHPPLLALVDCMQTLLKIAKKKDLWCSLGLLCFIQPLNPA